MLLRWLRNHLEAEPEEQLQHFFAWAMYDRAITALSEEESGLVGDFLAALKQTACDRHLLAALRCDSL